MREINYCEVDLSILKIREPSAKQNKNQNLKSKIRPRYIIDITKNIDQNNKYYNNIDHMQCFFLS